MFIKYIFLGFIVESLASFDDVVTRIPVISYLTKTRKGKIAFSIGNFIALSIAVILAILLTSLIKNFQYSNYLTGGLIFILAILIYFDVFFINYESKAKKKLVKKVKKISTERFIKLIVIGFLISFVTFIDDIIVISPLFLKNDFTGIAAIIGIFISGIIQIIAMIYFAEKLDKVKYLKEIATGGLVILGVLVILGIV